MNKIIRFSVIIGTLMIIFFTASAQTGYAHTSLHESTPGAGDTVTENVTEIVLKYETKIEELSTFELWRNDSEQVDVINITVEQDTMTGTLGKSLPNGDYTVKWDIIGADGHPISGDFSFTVQVPEQPTETNQNVGQADQSEETTGQSDSTNEQSETTTEQQDETGTDQDSRNPAEDSDAGMDAPNSEIEWGIVLPLVVILTGGATWLLLRRKRN